MERLEQYVALLEKWNPRINLVAKSTIRDVWSRHILDSAQIFEIPPRPVRHWIDLGSGGGFPGMVIAALAHERDPQIQVTLVESDVRKSVFLRNVARELDLNVRVENERIENLDPLNADVVSARALADLSTLLCLSHRHLSKDGMMIFLKGKNWSSEVEKAQSEWNFEHQIVKSKTSEGSIILCVSGVHRV